MDTEKTHVCVNMIKVPVKDYKHVIIYNSYNKRNMYKKNYALE